MSEQEQEQQIGRLVTECDRLKRDLAHIQEKVHRAANAYKSASAILESVKVIGGVFVNPGSPMARDLPAQMEDLLGAEDLKQLLLERDRLRAAVDDTCGRLRAVAPNLL